MTRPSIFAFLGVIAFCLTIALAKPSNAVSSEYQKLIDLGIVDAVATPKELGLEYLQKETVHIDRDKSVMDALSTASDVLSGLEQFQPVSFPAGTNYPLATGAMGATPNPPDATNVQIQGYLNRNGEAKNWSAEDGKKMVSSEISNGGNLATNNTDLSAYYNVAFDSSGILKQARRVPTMAIIVYDPRTRRRLAVPNINANAVCRDLVNATLTGNLRRI